MTAVRDGDRQPSGSVTLSAGPRPVFATQRSLEVHAASAETVSAIDHDIQMLQEMVARQRARASARAVGAASLPSFA